jgi:glycosyltransferase involved in cell wall biosynthesis
MILRAIRKKKLQISFSIFWLIIGILLIIALLIPNLVENISKALGFEVPANMVFCLTIFVSFYLIFNLTISISKENKKNTLLIQEVSMLKKRVEELEKMQNKKVSIIVPIYNAQEHLKICLDSILNQTYKNIELILVNDGSTDNSIGIMKEYKEKYPEIINIITKENTGVSDTRNLGLGCVTGYYTMFSDNDDYMEENYIESYINADDNDYDIIIGGYIRKSYNGKVLFKRKLKDKELSPYIQLASWGKLYKTSYIRENEFKFLKTAIADDFYFNLFAYNNTDKIKIIDNIGYHWMFNETSLSNTDSKKMNRTDDLIVTLNQIHKDLKPKNNEIIDYFYLRTVIYYILFSCKKVEYNKIIEEYNKLFKWLEEHTKDYKKNKYLKLFNNSGEQTSVKFVIYVFMLLKKLHLIKPFIFIYSKV